MGIRVDENSLLSQLKEAGCEERKEWNSTKICFKESSLTPLEGVSDSRGFACIFWRRLI